jgi:sugar lactone lactonase YvrE
VTDTGNKRLINYTKNGDFIRSLGTGGAGLGELNEAVGLAFDSSGGLLVADTWNGRIERFAPDGASATAFTAGWTSTDAAHKPYLAVLTDGRILATEPAKGYLMLFDGSGTPQGTWKPADGARPIGVAATSDGGFVFSDAARGEVQIVPGALISKLFK